MRKQETFKDLSVLYLCVHKHVYTFVMCACYGLSLLQSCLTVELYPTERPHCWAAGSSISPVQLDSPQHVLPGGKPNHLPASQFFIMHYCGSRRIRTNVTISLDVYALKRSASLFFSQHSYSAISEDLSKKHLDQRRQAQQATEQCPPVSIIPLPQRVKNIMSKK